MALPDLLQWASVNRKTGLFQLHRNQMIRGIAFKEGNIVACATNDPSLVAHYLISGGAKAGSEAIRAAVDEYRRTGKRLDQIILDRGLLTARELAQELASKSEETIYSMFDWVDAEFSFEELEPTDPMWIAVDTSVDEILLSGLQRLDEMKMIRRVFDSSGIVLELTGQPAPKEIAHSGTARRILASIDGKATLADVLVRADASEFLVLKLLYHLFHKDVARIVETRPAAPGSATLLDDPEELRVPAAHARPAASTAVPAAQADAGREPVTIEASESEPFFEEATLDPETLLSLALVAKQLEAGIEDVGSRSNERGPRADAVRLEDLSMDSIPVPQHTPESLAREELTQDEEYLVSVIDGHSTLEGILSMAPLDHAGLLIAVQDLVEKKLIHLDRG